MSGSRLAVVAAACYTLVAAGLTLAGQSIAAVVCIAFAAGFAALTVAAVRRDPGNRPVLVVVSDDTGDIHQQQTAA